jgi:hypothetical protein
MSLRLTTPAHRPQEVQRLARFTTKSRCVTSEAKRMMELQARPLFARGSDRGSDKGSVKRSGSGSASVKDSGSRRHSSSSGGVLVKSSSSKSKSTGSSSSSSSSSGKSSRSHLREHEQRVRAIGTLMNMGPSTAVRGSVLSSADGRTEGRTDSRDAGLVTLAHRERPKGKGVAKVEVEGEVEKSALGLLSGY